MIFGLNPHFASSREKCPPSADSRRAYFSRSIAPARAIAMETGRNRTNVPRANTLSLDACHGGGSKKFFVGGQAKQEKAQSVSFRRTLEVEIGIFRRQLSIDAVTLLCGSVQAPTPKEVRYSLSGGLKLLLIHG
jgi:hypothetical protein